MDDGAVGGFTLKEQKKRSQEIDAMLREEKKRQMNQCTLLMLGPGQSGKSTFCKQMKILHLIGFTEEEKENFKYLIHTNIIQATLDLIVASQSSNLPFNDPTNQKVGKKMFDAFVLHHEVKSHEIHLDNMIVQVYSMDRSMAGDIKGLWEDEATQEILSKAELTTNDSIYYYLKHLDRISSEEFVPDNLDILFARLRTTAVSETTFWHEGAYFKIVDVGGQRGERTKWLPLFSDVTAIIFCVAMSDYDNVMEEDDQTNRMHDSLQLWDTVINNRFLNKVPAVLFLNKKDLFEEKIKKVDLKVCFPEYKGGKNYDKAVEFLERKFRSAKRKHRTGDIYTHITQATDTRNIEVVWNAVKSILLNKAVDDFGFGT